MVIDKKFTARNADPSGSTSLQIRVSLFQVGPGPDRATAGHGGLADEASQVFLRGKETSLNTLD